MVNIEELILIDDEPLANKIHSRLIGALNKELQITTFTDPVEGLDYLKRSHPETLLLLDINMPEMDAWDCLNYMKDNDINIPTVILSSSINPQDKQKASEFSNVIGFLNKPLTKENIKVLLPCKG